MAPPAGTLRVGRYFLALVAVLVVLGLIAFWPGTRHTPKLGIDLAGGQEVVFTAKTTDGKNPPSSDMETAKEIMTERVNGSGVTQATVVIQGNNELVVSIPGSSNLNLAELGQAAQLNLRGLVAPTATVSCVSSAAASASPSASPSASGSGASTGASTPSTTTTGSSGSASAHGIVAPFAAASGSASAGASSSAADSGSASASPSATASGSTTGSGTASASPSASATSTPCVTTPLSKLGFAVPTSETAYDALTSAQQASIQSALANFDCAKANTQSESASTYLSCDSSGSVYLLGPVIVPGTQISGASAGLINGSSSWSVNLSMKSSGQAAWAKYTAAHNTGSSSLSTASSALCGSTMTASGGDGTPCADFVGFTLDGQILSAPVNESAINGGQTQITGSFNQSSANTLARQLKYGALPLTFTASNVEQVSASLGSSQLKAGLLAGGIGLILVVIYSLIYYRALGLVTIASLIVSAALTYGSLVMLGTQINYTLSLAGIAGFIVAIGITADSFVVFFERIKDEVHEGRSMRVAVPRAWIRARRTILSADTVSFLAAAVLYYFASSDVKGFAFTLGLSTILDLVVVFLFTHPLISLLSRSRAFGSARFTGLNAVREGGIANYDAREAALERADRAARAKGRRTTDAPDAAATGEPDPEQRFAGVAVLGRRTEPTVEPSAEVADEAPATEEPDEDTGPVSEAAPPVEPAVEDEPETPPAPRRRTTPAPGSAAERAAARRAKQRAERDQNDEGGH